MAQPAVHKSLPHNCKIRAFTPNLNIQRNHHYMCEEAEEAEAEEVRTLADNQLITDINETNTEWGLLNQNGYFINEDGSDPGWTVTG